MVSLATVTLSCFWPTYWPTIAHFYSPWLPLPFEGVWSVLLLSVAGQMVIPSQRRRLERTAVVVHLFAIACIVVSVLACVLWKGMFKAMGMDVYNFSLLAFVVYCGSMSVFFMLRTMMAQPRVAPAIEPAKPGLVLAMATRLRRLRLSWQATVMRGLAGVSVRPVAQAQAVQTLAAGSKRVLALRSALEQFRLMLFSSQNGRRGRG